MGAGENWKKRREEMEMTIEDAAAALRISRRYIQGIEEGNFRGWPERVFSSGFIRAYARLLSEDPEPVLSEYYQHLETTVSGEPTGVAPPEWLERERQKGTRRTSYAVASMVVLFIGVLLAWLASRMSSRPATETAVPSAPAKSASARPPAAAVPSPAAAPAASPAPDNAAVPEAPPAQGSVASIGGAGPVTAPYQLFLEASELSWLMYSLDDGEPVDVMLYPGDKISIQAKKKIFLKLGNAGGLVGTLNGKLLPPFGSKGQVKEFRLGE